MELWQAALAVGGMLVSAGAVYGGIRSDLKNMHERLAEHAERIQKIQDDGCGSCFGRRRGDKSGG